METGIIGVFSVMAASVIAALVIAVPLHELGHLIGGAVTGYRFTSITVFGIRIYRDYGRIGICRQSNGPSGQCLMYPRFIGQNPVALITGGIAANVIVGMFFLAAGIVTDDIKKMVACICIGGINLIMGLLNAVPDSPTNDGSTLKDVLKSSRHVEIYNRIMMVYRELQNGRKYGELSEELLGAPDIYDSTLSAELALYRYYRIRDMYADDSANQNLIRIERLKLARYSPETGVSEAFENE